MKKVAAYFLFGLIFFACNKDEKLNADFTMSKNNVKYSNVIYFTNNSVSASSYLWDFGDSVTSKEVSPSHQYTKAGIYAVKLVAKGSDGQLTISKNITLTEIDDSTDLYIGDYRYKRYEAMNLTGYVSDSFTINKDGLNKLVVIQKKLITTTKTYFTVHGDSIREDSCQTADIFISGHDNAITFKEKSKGSIKGRFLTIEGEWTNPAYSKYTFTIEAVKK